MKRGAKIYLVPQTELVRVQVEGTFAASVGEGEGSGAEIETQPGNENGGGTIGEGDFGENPWL